MGFESNLAAYSARWGILNEGVVQFNTSIVQSIVLLEYLESQRPGLRVITAGVSQSGNDSARSWAHDELHARIIMLENSVQKRFGDDLLEQNIKFQKSVQKQVMLTQVIVAVFIAICVAHAVSANDLTTPFI